MRYYFQGEMRSTIIKPDEKFCDILDDVKIVGFKNSEGYFMIQRVDDDPKNFHIELDDQGQGCYDGLESVIINDDKIIFKLNLKGQKHLNTEKIEIIDDILDNLDYVKFLKEIGIINQCLENNSAQQNA